jgi:hypothetical protein
VEAFAAQNFIEDETRQHHREDHPHDSSVVLFLNHAHSPENRTGDQQQIHRQHRCDNGTGRNHGGSVPPQAKHGKSIIRRMISRGLMDLIETLDFVRSRSPAQ